MNTVKKLRPHSEVVFIDIKPGRYLYSHPKTPARGIRKYWDLLPERLKMMVRYIAHPVRKNDVYLLYRHLWRKYLRITENHHWDDRFDTVIIGSDEVFNCLQDARWGFSKNLLGEGINSSSIISYAASCGYTTVEKVEAMGLSGEVGSALKNISVFSARDENTAAFVAKLTGKKAEMHLDPVFLFDYAPYLAGVKKPATNRPFMLVYVYHQRINDRAAVDAIVQFARDNGLRIISAFGAQTWCENRFLSPFEILEHFRRAAFVISDTFHGAVFSIKYNKRFVQFVHSDEIVYRNGWMMNNQNSQKIQGLLDVFSLRDRIVTDTTRLGEQLKTPIDYKPINERIRIETAKSLAYLDANIAQEKRVEA